MYRLDRVKLKKLDKEQAAHILNFMLASGANPSRSFQFLEMFAPENTTQGELFKILMNEAKRQSLEYPSGDCDCPGCRRSTKISSSESIDNMLADLTAYFKKRH